LEFWKYENFYARLLDKAMAMEYNTFCLLWADK